MLDPPFAGAFQPGVFVDDNVDELKHSNVAQLLKERLPHLHVPQSIQYEIATLLPLDPTKDVRDERVHVHEDERLPEGLQRCTIVWVLAVVSSVRSDVVTETRARPMQPLAQRDADLGLASPDRAGKYNDDPLHTHSILPRRRESRGGPRSV